MKPVGLLWDSVSNNIGDQAIGLVMRKFSSINGLAHEILNPFDYDSSRYSTIVVGGGELLRHEGEPFYDCFRVRGNHILNATGIHEPDHLDYLNNYCQITVRSESEKQFIQTAVPDVKVSPCVTTLMEDYFPAQSEQATREQDSTRETIGVHLHYSTVQNIPGIFTILRELNRKYRLVFVPFTLYNGDRLLLETYASQLPDASVSPVREPVGIFKSIAQFKGFISSSLHAALFAYIQNIPVLAFPYAAKINYFFEERSLSESLFRSGDELIAKIDQFELNRPDYSKAIQADKAKARQHLDDVLHALKSFREDTQAEPRFSQKWSSAYSSAYHQLMMQNQFMLGQATASYVGLQLQISEKTDQVQGLQTEISRLTDLAAEGRAAQQELTATRGTLAFKLIQYLFWPLSKLLLPVRLRRLLKSVALRLKA